MKVNSLGTKIGTGYFVALLLLITTVTITIFAVNNIELNSKQAFNINAPISYQSQSIQTNINRSLAALRGWVALGQPQFQQQLKDTWLTIDTTSQQLNTLMAAKNNSAELHNFKQLESDIEQLKRFQFEVANIAQTPDNQPGMQIFYDDAAPKAQEINAIITEMIELEMLGNYDNNHRLLLKNMADFRGSMANSIAAIRAYLLSEEIKFKEQFRRYAAVNEESILYIEQQQHLLTPEQQRNLVRLKHLRNAFLPLVDTMFTVRKSEDWDLAKKWMTEKVVPLEQKINADIERIVHLQQAALVGSLSNIQKNYSDLTTTSITLLLIGILVFFSIAWYLTRLVVNPINRVIELAQQISLGKLIKDIDLRGAFEIEQLSSTLKKMTGVLQQVTRHANKLADGDYSKDFSVQGSQDQLGNALQQMTASLRNASQESNDLNWLKTGEAGLSDCLRGDSDVMSICQNSLNYLVKYLDVQVAAVYLHQKGKLSLVTSYAYQVRSNNETEFALGQGMVGQVALEQTTVIFNDVPDDHLALPINSGLGDSAAPSILVFPLINRQNTSNEVVGVIALGTNNVFSPIDLELVDKVSESIAIAIESANAQTRVQALLEESRQQSEELQMQQEELTAANEELEEQTSSLKQTEEELRAQSENLKKSNSALEQQKQSIEHKNKEVEAARQEIELRAKELELASKYKSEFLANMSHELRTPLNSLLILSQVMGNNSQGNLTDEQVQDIEMIHNGGKTLLTLINDILDLSKVEAGKLKLNFEELSIDNLLESMKRQFTPLAQEKGIKFKLTASKGIPQFFYSDGQRLEQILRNLLSNAVKFTEQGQVELRIANAQADFNFKNPQFPNDNVLAFSVIDSGIGIPSAQQQAIFEAFQQGDGSTNRKFGGTGLGLTISRELSRLLGAEIHLSSEEGKGSTFTLYVSARSKELAQAKIAKTTQDMIVEELPQATIKEVPLNQVFIPDDRSSVTNTDKVLLIVEDDKAFAQSVMDFAHKRGFKCLVTDKGMEALELVMRHATHAIILDLGLSDIHGLKVLEALKASPMTRDIPVHIISAQDVDDDVMKKGAMGFLNKPTDLDALEKVLAKFDSFNRGAVKQILLIEDDELSCQSIRRFLQDKQIQITTAHSGKLALEQIQSRQFDCIILDLSLQDMTGQEWLNQVEQQNIALPPVIIYTGKELSDPEYKDLLNHANRIVIKANQAPERLQEEIALFLHLLNEENAQQNVIENIEDLASAFKGKRILVVDDDLRNTYALSKVLKEYGMEVIIADNGELAIEKLAQEQQVDLILMDIMMPVMDGYEAIKIIRSKYNDKHPIIALTAKAMPEDRENCINAGANDYLAKPVDINRLVSMVKVWLYQ